MKFNLKNLDKSLEEPSDEMDKLDAFVKWRDGFEKELRELMKSKAEWGKRCSSEEPQYSKVWGQYDLIKEILGE